MVVPALPGSPKRALFVAKVVCGAVMWIAGIIPAQAQEDTLYGALILATNADHPPPPPEELRTQAANLRAVFGYNEFRVLGRKRKVVTKGTEDWLVPSRQFFLRVDTKNPVAGGYALGLKLLDEDRVLVEAEVKLNRERPLFIRGPFVGQGQLIILLMVL